MSLDLNKPHTFVSKYHPIKLIATDFDEPYYGLTLWRFRLYVEDTIFHHPLLDYDNKFCGLSSILDNFVFESQKGDYVFIPYGLIVMNTTTYELTKYEVKRGANNDFIKNIFLENKLIVLNQRSIWVVNLSEKSMTEKTYTFGTVSKEDFIREFVKRDLFNISDLSKLQWRVKGGKLTKEKVLEYLSSPEAKNILNSFSEDRKMSLFKNYNKLKGITDKDINEFIKIYYNQIFK